MSVAADHMSHKEQEAYYAALRAGHRILDKRFVAEAVAVSPGHAVLLLHRLNRKGAVERVGKGQYALVPPEVLSGRRSRGVDLKSSLHALMQRAGVGDAYYVGYQSAAQLHGAAHQQPFVLQVASAWRRRPLRVGSEEARFVSVPRERIFGVEERRYGEVPLRISDRERTALDLVDRPDLGGGMSEVAGTFATLMEDADPLRLAGYAERLGQRQPAQRVGWLLARLSLSGAEPALDALRRLRGPNVVPLEPSGDRDGEVDRDWRVRVNVPLGDPDW